jgi:catechol 2,3-dioxygenase-like lactoylglutathione lyase family enzyme
MPIRLDHIALATRDVAPALDTLVGELGGLVLSGGLAIGYRPMQVHMGTADAGMKLELLEPWEVEQNDFLDRFVDRHGDGAHHLTFKVDSLEAALDDVRAAGLTPVGIEMSTDIWKEAFIQPREAHGTVVQLAESSSDQKTPFEEFASVQQHGMRPGDFGVQWWPDPPDQSAERTLLMRVVMRAPSVHDVMPFFVGLLEGEHVDRGEGWVELAWPGGGHIRFEERPGEPPGIDHLELEGPGPARELTIAGARFVINP